MPTQVMIKNDLPRLLRNRQTGPFVSIYIETNPIINDLSQQKLAFKEAIKTAQIAFSHHFPFENWRPYEAQLSPLIEDNDFWFNNQQPWTGIVVNHEELYIFDLTIPVQHQITVSAMPAVLPLIHNQQLKFNYDLLCLNEDCVRLFQKRDDQFHEVKFDGEAPVTKEKALGTETRGGDLNFHAGPTGGANHGVNYHGHNVKAEERVIDQRNFYQKVDQYLNDHYSKPTQSRLILCGLPQNQAVFRQISKNQFLLKHLKIDQSPAGRSRAEIGSLAEGLTQAWNRELQTILLQRYDSAKSRKLTIEDPFLMVIPAVDGRIQELLVARDRKVAGTISSNGAVITDSASVPDNLADDLADLVLAMGGKVHILPTDQMPNGSEAIALLRY